MTCGGTEYGQCINPSNDSTQLTLRGASKGRWSTPVAFGDVEIGLFATGKRAGSVSSIAGVLDVAAMHHPGRATVEFDITRVAGFYVGSIQIVDDVTGAIVALVHHRRLHQASDGTVSGHIKWLDEDGNRHGLRWSVRDGDLSP